jgi:hypothetical protein
VRVRRALIDIRVAKAIRVAIVASATKIVDTKVSAEAVGALIRRAIVSVQACRDAITFEAGIADAIKASRFVLTFGKNIAIVIPSNGVTLVLIHVAIRIDPAHLASALVGIGTLVCARTMHTRPLLIAIVQTWVAIVDVFATLDNYFRLIFTVVVNVVFNNTHCVPKTISCEACVTIAIVASRVVLARRLVVTGVNTHGTLVPVRAAGGSTPPSNAFASEAESPAVDTSPTMSAWRELAIVRINTRDAVACPTSVTSACIRTHSVCAQRIFITAVQARGVFALIRVLTLVFILLTVVARPPN